VKTVGQRIATFIDKNRVYDQKPDGTEALNREKTVAKNAEAAKAHYDNMMESDTRGIAGVMTGIGVLSEGAALLGVSANWNGSELTSLMTGAAALMGVVVGAPAVIMLLSDGVKGLLGAKDSLDHAWHAHQLAKESIHLG
jgi:hypothetical protein